MLDKATHSLILAFSAVVVIVPKEKREDALYAAREAGATGVTILDAHGMSLSQIDNIFRPGHEDSDALMLFVLPERMVNKVIKNIALRLHIETTQEGIAFAFPLTHMKGISLRQQDIIKEEVGIKDE